MMETLSSFPPALGPGPRTLLIEDQAAFLRTDMPSAARASYRKIFVGLPFEFGRTDEDDIAFICQLREATSFGIAVSWSADGSPNCDPTLLHHLGPPSDLGSHAAVLEAWQDSFVNGSCYYRKGPHFALVRDARRPSRVLRHRLTGDALELFDRLQTYSSVREIDGYSLRVIQSLEAARIVGRIGSFVTSLPCRMRRWPTGLHR
ncbi:DUF5825 family protein [Acrocarpospora macrocephala]|uniref:DUF5825 family protein n=1 Tax=Acrocarpospora macrocephala TaxID=150177 RepID=UPI0035A230A7